MYSGFTTVYDAGNDPDFIFDLRARERAGSITSPRIFASGGVVTTPGGHGAGRVIDRGALDLPVNRSSTDR